MNCTKGEWIVDNGDSELWGIFSEEDLDPICYLGDMVGMRFIANRDFDESKANANLIAAAPDMHKDLTDASGWLARFVMKFYIQAEHPTYEKMKVLYQELDTFQRTLGEQALAKAEGKEVGK